MDPNFTFRLYIAGDGPNSVQAVTNLGVLCREHLPDRHHIEIIDVFLDPLRALKDGIFLTPTLVKLSPAPSGRIVGTLSDAGPVLHMLGLRASFP